ncbi:XVIPCD domain-containing protein [Lysobacter sp. CA199]|uniref:XVIPCD domain-containing protein n=1 Tax=Lysobacter sp. CA199 TaxID=3455608 RepID=UPI003F8D3034
MITPNRELSAAIVRFEQQPGVSAQQVAQLRAALSSDEGMLRDLNQEALSGQLRGFAVQPATATPPSLIGSYDLASGVVTLPAASFQATGTAASPDLRAAIQVQEMSVRFGNSRYADPSNPAATLPVTQDMLNNLQGTINGSPALAAEVKRAATMRDPGDVTTPTRNHLENFGFISGISAGGTYDGPDKTMRLPAARLQSPPAGQYDATDMSFVLGHEIEHGFNYPRSRQANNALHTGAQAVAAQPGVVHDYTGTIRTFIQDSRNDEAEAEIAGWNAALSRLKQTNPSANLADMLNTGNPRMLDFVERDPATNTVRALVAPPGQPQLTFNADGTITATADNVAAMGRQYFDRPPVTPGPAVPGQRPLAVGERGSSDYPNYYGAHAIEVAIQAERTHAAAHPGVTHRMTVNMAGLNLSENLLEREGINIRTNPATPQPYYDSGQTPPALHHFNHTQNGSVNPAHDHQHVPIMPAPDAAHSPTTSSSLDALSPNDRAMHARIREGIAASVPDEAVTRAVQAAKLQGIERPEQIASSALVNDRLWVSSTVPGFVASVDVNARTTGQEASAQTPAQNDQRERAAAQQPAETQEAARSGPRM